MAFIKQSKIGKILNSVSKSALISKPIKTSVDELIQDWKEKFVQDAGSSSTEKKKPTINTASGDKRKQRSDADEVVESPPVDVLPVKKKGMYISITLC